jgi:hypothetical protein
LRQLQHDLVWKYDLDFDFVRKEWATILEPTVSQAELCENLIKKNKEKAAVEEMEELNI